MGGGGVLGGQHGLKGLDMHQVHEDAGQQIQHEIATDRHGPGPDDREHQVERGEEHEALQQAHPDGDHGIAMGLAHLPDGGVVSHAEEAEQKRPRIDAPCGFEHLFPLSFGDAPTYRRVPGVPRPLRFHRA
jgi:hypothetical protein